MLPIRWIITSWIFVSQKNRGANHPQEKRWSNSSTSSIDVISRIFAMDSNRYQLSKGKLWKKWWCSQVIAEQKQWMDKIFRIVWKQKESPRNWILFSFFPIIGESFVVQNHYRYLSPLFLFYICQTHTKKYFYIYIYLLLLFYCYFYRKYQHNIYIW